MRLIRNSAIFNKRLCARDYRWAKLITMHMIVMIIVSSVLLLKTNDKHVKLLSNV